MSIVKVTFKNKITGEIYNMLFGDSYKSWKQQYEEYCRDISDTSEPVSAYQSKAQWISYGGLKWCSEADFQEELDYEAKCLKIMPRNYFKMVFNPINLPE